MVNFLWILLFFNSGFKNFKCEPLSPQQSVLDATVCLALSSSGARLPSLFQVCVLAGVHVTGPDLLPVLAAGQLGGLKPLLHCHQPLLNASATRFGTFCPG